MMIVVACDGYEDGSLSRRRLSVAVLPLFFLSSSLLLSFVGVVAGVAGADLT